MPLALEEFKELELAVDNAEDPNDKGQALEDLCECFFSGIEGVEVREKRARTASEEIDLLLWNGQVDQVLSKWEAVILVECKNWSDPVGVPELDAFIAKLRRRGLRNGVLVAANGVTGDFSGAAGGASRIIESALQESIHVVTLTLDELTSVQSNEDIHELFKTKLCRMFLYNPL